MTQTLPICATHPSRGQLPSPTVRYCIVRLIITTCSICALSLLPKSRIFKNRIKIRSVESQDQGIDSLMGGIPRAMSTRYGTAPTFELYQLQCLLKKIVRHIIREAPRS